MKEEVMKYLLRCHIVLALGLVLLWGATATPALAQRSKESKIDRKDLDKATKHAQEAAKVFEEIMRAPDNGIPQDLLNRAEAVAVFPKVVKAAFIIGGSGGKGVISRRTPQGWSAPAFFKLGGGSFGAQIGAEETDYVLLFMNEG